MKWTRVSPISEGFNGRHWHRGYARLVSWHIVLLEDKNSIRSRTWQAVTVESEAWYNNMCQIIWAKRNQYMPTYILVAAVVRKWRKWQFNFRKIVWRNMCKVCWEFGNMTKILFQIFCWIQLWQNFEIQSTYAEVMHECRVACFFWLTVYVR